MNCLIVSSHTLTIFGFNFLLKEIVPAVTLATASSLDQGIERITNGTLPPSELVLVDLPDPHIDADRMYRLRIATPAPATIAVVSYCSNPSLTATYRRHGADVVVSKDWTSAAIATALTEAIAARNAVRAVTARPQEIAKPLPPLTTRQHDIVALLLAGRSNKLIASSLNLTYGTVKNYMFDLMRLLSVRSRLELVAKIREGSVPSVATATESDPPSVRGALSTRSLAARSATLEAHAATAAVAQATANTLHITT